MCIVNKDGDAEWNAEYCYFVFKISVQFNNLRAANINKLNNLVSGDAAKAVYIRSCQVKTCAIGPDLELHNSNYMSHFLYSQNPFLKACEGT